MFAQVPGWGRREQRRRTSRPPCAVARAGARRARARARERERRTAGDAGGRVRLPLAAKVWVILNAAAWCAVSPAAAQANGATAAGGSAAVAAGTGPEQVREVRFEPARFVAGDRVLARIVVRGAAPLTAPEAVASGDWLSVHDVEVLPRTDGSWEVHVRFSSYRPGVAELPPIDVGPFELTGVGFLTASVLPRYGELPPTLRPPAPQMAIPGTAAVLIGGAGAVLVVPYLLVSGALLLAGAARRAGARRSRARPRVLLERGVQRLQAGGSNGAHGTNGRYGEGGGAAGVSGVPGASAPPGVPHDAVTFYAGLSQLAREYLAGRLALPAYAMTVRELREALPERGLPHGLGADLTAILDTADRVKFAGSGAADAEMQAAARQLVTLARAIDAVLEERAARGRGGGDVEL